MEQTIFKRIGLPLAILFVIILAAMLLYGLRGGDPRLSKADAEYHAGEASATIAERQRSFNNALDLYISLDKDYQPQFGTGRLYYNIGNTYFQLGEYARAVLFYERANSLMPREDRVKRNLGLARDKLGIPKDDEVGAFGKVFFFHTYLSLPERLQLFFALCVVALICSSAYLWSRKLLYRSAAIGMLALAVIMLLSLAYTRFISPLEGVLVRSVELRRDAGNQYAKVGEQPIPAGTKVEILDVRSANGLWLKVLAPNGDLGYLPQEGIGLIGP